VDAVNGDGHLREVSFAAELIDVIEGAFKRYEAGEGRFPVEGREMGHPERGGDVEVGEVDAGLGGMAFLEFGTAVELEVCPLEATGGVVDESAFGGVSLDGEESERLTADGEAGDVGVTLDLGIFESAGAGEREFEAASHLVVELTKGLDFCNVDAVGLAVNLETM
jgi:hypothetical protein